MREDHSGGILHFVDFGVFDYTGIVGCASGSVAIAFSSAGVPIFRAHNLIDDVRCLCPQGHRDLTAMWRFAVLYFLSRKRKIES